MDQFDERCLKVLKLKEMNNIDNREVEKCIEQMKYIDPDLTEFLPKTHSWFKILSSPN